MINKLIRLSKDMGIEIIDRGNGHIQLKGQLLVNYYPESKDCSAYVAGTRNKVKYVTPQQAIEMTFTPPTVSPYTKHRRNTKPIKWRLLKKSNTCLWCNKELTFKTATLEHIIPLYRGGLDNENNMALACKECNEKRGHNMPELEQNHD